MTETLFRKSWQPLAEADKSARQVVRNKNHHSSIYTATFRDGVWFIDINGQAVPGWSAENPYHSHEFLCLEPVEVETDDFPKVI